jgi:hypothetical protein
LVEHRLDEALSAEVELLAGVGRQNSTDEVVKTAATAGAGFLAPIGVWGDQWFARQDMLGRGSWAGR